MSFVYRAFVRRALLFGWSRILPITIASHREEIFKGPFSHFLIRFDRTTSSVTKETKRILSVLFKFSANMDLVITPFLRRYVCVGETCVGIRFIYLGQATIPTSPRRICLANDQQIQGCAQNNRTNITDGKKAERVSERGVLLPPKGKAGVEILK